MKIAADKKKKNSHIHGPQNKKSHMFVTKCNCKLHSLGINNP